VRVYVSGRKIYRFVVLLILLFLFLPVLYFYLYGLADPKAVHFREPRGEALKVSADVDSPATEESFLSRFVYYSKQFYQNGL